MGTPGCSRPLDQPEEERVRPDSAEMTTCRNANLDRTIEVTSGRGEVIRNRHCTTFVDSLDAIRPHRAAHRTRGQRRACRPAARELHAATRSRRRSTRAAASERLVRCTPHPRGEDSRAWGGRRRDRCLAAQEAARSPRCMSALAGHRGNHRAERIQVRSSATIDIPTT